MASDEQRQRLIGSSIQHSHSHNKKTNDCHITPFWVFTILLISLGLALLIPGVLMRMDKVTERYQTFFISTNQ
jgi:hypothetical protein